MMIGKRMVANQRGSVINVALLVLMLLALLGITFAGLSSTDIKIAANDRTQSMAFYAAEAARSYVEANADLYGQVNSVIGESVSFPNMIDSSVPQPLGGKQSFSGYVTYVAKKKLNRTPLPGPAGFSTGFSSKGSTGYKQGNRYEYLMVCKGRGPASSSAEYEIQAGFYREGL